MGQMLEAVKMKDTGLEVLQRGAAGSVEGVRMVLSRWWPRAGQSLGEGQQRAAYEGHRRPWLEVERGEVGVEDLAEARGAERG